MKVQFAQDLMNWMTFQGYIGRGANGVVFADPDDPGRVLKITRGFLKMSFDKEVNALATANLAGNRSVPRMHYTDFYPDTGLGVIDMERVQTQDLSTPAVRIWPRCKRYGSWPPMVWCTRTYHSSNIPMECRHRPPGHSWISVVLPPRSIPRQGLRDRSWFITHGSRSWQARTDAAAMRFKNTWMSAFKENRLDDLPGSSRTGRGNSGQPAAGPEAHQRV